MPHFKGCDCLEHSLARPAWTHPCRALVAASPGVLLVGRAQHEPRGHLQADWHLGTAQNLDCLSHHTNV